MKYNKDAENQKIFMVHIEETQINACALTENKFIWNETARLFARPGLFAVFLGALVDISSSFLSGTTNRLQSTGFAFPDASCFPSYNHVNGDAFDTLYFMDNKLDNTGGTIANDLAYIQAIHKYGNGLFRIGPGKNNLRTQVVVLGIECSDEKGSTLHNDHLHTEKIKVTFRGTLLTL
jgi:hypothetical protein